MPDLLQPVPVTTQILLVEDEEDVAASCKYVLEEKDQFQVQIAGSYDEAKKRLQDKNFDIAIVDLKLREYSDKDAPSSKDEYLGIRLIQELAALISPPIVIVSTGYLERAEKNPEFPQDFVFAKHDKLDGFAKLRERADEAKKLKRVQTLLSEASKYTSGSLSIRDELSTMARQLVRLTGAYVCHLLLPTEDRLYLEIVVGTRQDEGSRVDMQDSVSGTVFTTREPLILGDTSEYKHYKSITGDVKMFSEMAVPLRESSNRVIGVLNLEAEPTNAFTEEDKEIAEAFAAFFVTTLQNDRRRRDLRLFVETTSALVQPHINLNAIYDIVVQLGAKLINADAGLLARRKGEKQLEIAATTNQSEWPMGFLFAIDTSICGLAVLQGYAINIADVDQERYKHLYQAAFGPKKKSELVVPLKLDENIIGVLNFESVQSSAFTSEDERVMLVLAHQASLAIRIAEDHEKQESNARLRERSEIVAELATNFTHNVKRPANQILFDLNLNRLEHGDQINGEQWLLEFTQRLERAAKSIREVPHQIAENVERYRPPVAMTCFELISRTLDEMCSKKRIPDEIRIIHDESLKEPTKFRAYENGTHLVLDNLISNAINQMNGQGIIKLGAQLAREGKAIQLWIEDEGQGIPFHSREAIFDRHATRGLGLWLVRNHLEKLNAKIWIEDAADGVGTRFVIEFPSVIDGDGNGSIA